MSDWVTLQLHDSLLEDLDEMKRTFSALIFIWIYSYANIQTVMYKRVGINLPVECDLR